MTPTEILTEIKKLPFGEQLEVNRKLKSMLKEENWDPQELEFAKHLLEQGIIERIPDHDMTDEEYDEIEILEIVGEPLSEQLIRERI